MIRVAIAYGQQRSDRHGAIVYTLNDRQLKTSPHAKFTDTLRGLQVIYLPDFQTLQILTTYWNFDSKRNARKKTMQNAKDLRAASQFLKQVQTMIDKYNLPPQKFLEDLGLLQTQPEIQNVFERTGGRFYLFKALEEAKERVVIKCPWVSDRAIDNDLMLRLNCALDQGVQIDLGWGYKHDIGTVIKKDRHGNFTFAAEAQYHYSGMSKLFQLQKHYSDRLHIKLTGGHSKFFVCDRQFAYVGSHNFLSSTIPNLKSTYPAPQCDETGIIHRNLEIIQQKINRYDQAIDLTDSNILSTARLTA